MVDRNRTESKTRPSCPPEKIMNFCRLALCLLIGLIAASAGSGLTEWGNDLEESLGLKTLFALRGPAAPPPEVVIISLDKASAQALALPDKPEKWPRSLHARLIWKLSEAGARLIAFNIVFDEGRNPQDDQLMANVMRRSHNVILSDYIKRGVISLSQNRPQDGDQFFYDLIIRPIPLFSQAALFSTPFTLPKTWKDVRQFWVHQDNGSCGFPAAVFQAYVFSQLYPEILKLTHQISPELANRLPPSYGAAVSKRLLTSVMLDFKTFFDQHHHALPEFIQLATRQIPASKRSLLLKWLSLYENPQIRYLNYYGPSGSITTISLVDVLSGTSQLFQDKVVFVGYSEDLHPEKSQGFYTVFSHSAADTFSATEIAATAFSNLLEDSWIRTQDPTVQFLFLIGWGTGLALLCWRLPLLRAFIMASIVGSIYFAIVYYQFVHNHHWYPLVIPLAIQIPAVLLVTLCCHYISTRQEKESIHQAFRLFLPEDITTQITSAKTVDALSSHGELKFGVCLATDAGRYTTLSESLDPMTLGQLMNEYYSTLFLPVKAHGGQISDVIGDAMMALWTSSEKSASLRRQACHAAIQIKQAVTVFNETHRYQLPTRIGLHSGMVRLGTLGSPDHYEYRAVGDAINTATRIENLNKVLGTRILVSADVARDLDEFYFRELGTFILAGKQQAIGIFELICLKEELPPARKAFFGAFAKALSSFKQHDWPKAHQAFTTLANQCPEDSPTLFYLFLCQSYLQEPPTTEHPEIIAIGNNSGHLKIDFV